jgi:hypothetical protein
LGIDWIKDEIEYIPFSDVRLQKRLSKILAKLSKYPASNLSEAFSNKEELKRYYEFISNESINYKDIIEGGSNKVIERINMEEKVLIASDTMEVDYSKLKSVDDLGDVNKTSKGMIVHSSFAVTTKGIPLGIVNQSILSRTSGEQKSKKRKEIKIKEKESYKWLEHYLYCQENINKPFIYIGDRESDIINLYSLPRAKNQDLLIRSMHNRKLKNSKLKLYEYLKSQPIQDYIEVETSYTKDKLPKKRVVSVRYAEVVISIPANNPDREELTSSKLNAIYVEEINSKHPKEEQLKWILLTTMDIKSVDDAIVYIYYYTLRWLIERYHFVLKSGCYIEKLQLKKEERLAKALAIYSIIAWRLLWLTYESRKDENQDATVFFSDIEWKYLKLTIGKSKDFSKIPTLKEITLMLALLGGYMNRKSDSPPGVKILWRGYRKLQERVIGFKEALAFFNMQDIFT